MNRNLSLQCRLLHFFPRADVVRHVGGGGNPPNDPPPGDGGDEDDEGDANLNLGQEAYEVITSRGATTTTSRSSNRWFLTTAGGSFRRSLQTACSVLERCAGGIARTVPAIPVICDHRLELFFGKLERIRQCLKVGPLRPGRFHVSVINPLPWALISPRGIEALRAPLAGFGSGLHHVDLSCMCSINLCNIVRMLAGLLL